ncbi:MAG: aspartate/glutamate racemase family protein [Spirochaetota bacterium]
MKRIGLIGGMSWESSLEYYRIVNEEVARRLGGLHSADCVLVSVDFAEIEAMQTAGDWDAAAVAIGDAAQSCRDAGADFAVLCTNTMHKVLGQVEARVDLPFLHIADATGNRIVAAGLRTVGLLGTRYTMEGDFYRNRLETAHGLNVLIPDEPARRLVHRVIYEELVLGRIDGTSREEFRSVIADLASRGAEGVVAGCTEIGLLVRPSDSVVPLFDTTRIHAEEAVVLALET